MEEKLYHSMKSIGITNLVMGILIIVFGIGVGISVLVNGAKLIKSKSDLMF